MRKGIVLLIAGGVAALIALLKKSGRPRETVERHIVLGTENGTCGVAQCPDTVTLSRSRRDKVKWIITNPSRHGEPCHQNVTVCLIGWKLRGNDTRAPVEDMVGGALCRPLNVHQPHAIINARALPQAEKGRYTFRIKVGNHVSDDPMLEIVE